MEGELKLTVNVAKSRVDRLARCVFLGCRIERKQIRWSEAAVDEFRAEVRRLTSRTWGVSMARRLGSLGRYVQGWFGYYRISRTWGEVRELDGEPENITFALPKELRLADGHAGIA